MTKKAFRVERVFEADLDSILDRIDKQGAELLRILDLPKGPLKSTDCHLCSDDELCGIHFSEHSRIQMLNRYEVVKVDREQLCVWLPRYAVVYRCDSSEDGTTSIAEERDHYKTALKEIASWPTPITDDEPSVDTLLRIARKALAKRG